MIHRDNVSFWGMKANTILFDLAYRDARRGFVPIGPLLPKLLDVKFEYVRMAEVAEAEGRPWTVEEFVSLCFDGFEKILGITKEAAAA